MKSITSAIAVIVGLLAVAPVAVQADQAARKEHKLESKADRTIKLAEKKDPSIPNLFERSYGYAVFPKIIQGGAGLGGAHGKGVVYERGAFIGEASLTQGTVGLQLGGESYSELIFFENEDVLRQFKANRLEFAAQTSAVALKAGTGAKANFVKGVTVFVISRKGLMAEAAIGGQRFHFKRKAS